MGIDDSYYDFVEAPEDYEGPGRDSYFDEVQQEIRTIYENDKKSVYYVRQMQIKFEKKYFHWVTYNAMIGLEKIGYLKDIRIPRGKGTSARFFIHKTRGCPSCS